MNDLRPLMDRIVMNAWRRSMLPGLIGKLNTDGTADVYVSDRPGYLWVRLGTGGFVRTNVKALNLGVAPMLNMPVLVQNFHEGLTVIMGVDPTRIEEFMQQAGDPYSVAPHTHRIGTGLEYENEMLRLEAGRVIPYASLTVYIKPFLYTDGGTRKYWSGGTIDLTSYLPATTGNWAWVLVGVDRVNNVAVAATGDEYSTLSPLDPSLLPDITFSADYEPCAAIRLKTSDTDLTAVAYSDRFVDAHHWLGGIGSAGNVNGPGSSTDTAVPRWDGTGGDTLQDSGVTITDNDQLVLPDSATYPPVNVTERSSAPSTPSTGDIYLDDGTNTSSGSPGWRRWNGSAWEDVGALNAGGVGLPVSSTDNAVVRWNGTGGDTIQDSTPTIDDNGKLTLPDSATYPPLNVTERSSAPSTPSTGDIYLDDGTNTSSGSPGWRRWNGASWEDMGGGGGGTTVEYVLLQYQLTSGTAGGTATSGSDQTRPLNTEVVDSGALCSLSSNQFTLSAGTYIICATAVAFKTDASQLILRNVSDSVDICRGLNAWSNNGTASTQTPAQLVYQFTLASSKTLELRHRFQTTRATDGMGLATSLGTETYAQVELWRLS